jgi:hypothetical protein
VHCYTKYSCYGVRDHIPNQRCFFGTPLGIWYCIDTEDLTCFLVQPDPNSAEDVNVASFGCH